MKRCSSYMKIVDDRDHYEYRDLDTEFRNAESGRVSVKVINTRNSDGFSERRENLIFIH